MPIEELINNFTNYLKKLENFLGQSFDKFNLENKNPNKNHFLVNNSKTWKAKTYKNFFLYNIASQIHLYLKNFNIYKKNYYNRFTLTHLEDHQW